MIAAVSTKPQLLIKSPKPNGKNLHDQMVKNKYFMAKMVNKISTIRLNYKN